MNRTLTTVYRISAAGAVFLALSATDPAWAGRTKAQVWSGRVGVVYDGDTLGVYHLGRWK